MSVKQLESLITSTSVTFIHPTLYLIIKTDKPDEYNELSTKLNYPTVFDNGVFYYAKLVAFDLLESLVCIDKKYQPDFEKFCHTSDQCHTFRYTLNHADAVAPSKVRASDSGYDLTLIRLLKKVGDVEFYDTGVAVCPPFGYYFDMVPRSSISKTSYMLANNVGVIDSSYTGNIIVPLRNFSDEETLELPCRIVQIIPRRIEHFEPTLVDKLPLTSRGDGGFGSTGK